MVTQEISESSISEEILQGVSQAEEHLAIDLDEIATTSSSSSHPWADLYSTAETTTRSVSYNSEFELDATLNKYRFSQAHEFRQQTLIWLHDRHQIDNTPKKNHSRPEYLVSWGKSNGVPNGVFAYYRVVSSNAIKVFLTPVHREVFAPDRGDLRLIELDETSFDRQNTTKSAVGSLFDGDILAVFKIHPVDSNMQSVPEIPPNHVMQHAFKPIWRVSEFCVMPRYFIRDTPTTCYKDASSLQFDAITNKPLLRMVASGLSRTISVTTEKFSTPPAEDNLFLADIFNPLPSQNADRFCADVSSAIARHQIYTFAAQLKTFPAAEASIVNVRVASDELMEKFNKAYKCFQVYDEETAISTIEMVMKWAASAHLAIQNEDYDLNIYHVRLNIEESSNNERNLFVRFRIERSNEPVKQSHWHTGTNLNIVLPSLFMTGIVYNTVMENGVLMVTARILKKNARQFRHHLAINADKFLLQAIISQDLSTEKDMISYTLMHTNVDFPDESPSREILRAIFGGKAIQWKWDNRIIYVADNYPEVIKMSASQNDYINGFLSKPPAIIANSPFGGGKTTTMVIAALEGCRLDDSIQLLLAVTNSSVANLVRTMGKRRTAESPNYIRLISKRNYAKIEDEFKTSFDSPVLLDTTFREFVLNYNDEISCENTENEYILRIAINYCIQYRILKEEDIENSRTREMFLLRKEHPIMEISKKCYVTTFLELYRPQIVFCTVSTAVSSISSTWSILNEKRGISAIQIDEASQLSLTAFIGLLAKFPYSRIAMIGDYRQLPPYGNQRNTAMVQRYAVGNLLEHAVENRLMPCVWFEKVFRSHPDITRILGREFYNNRIVASASADACSYFIRRASWWPNKSFPIALLDNDSISVVAGTSNTNIEELRLATLLLDKISTVIQERHVACVCFYRAQADRLITDNIGSPALIGTIDSHQGQEREVVVICTTRSTGNFLSDARRINVAMSRARQALIIIGNVNYLRNAAGWDNIVREIEEMGNVFDKDYLYNH